jgi:hypothetical protein
LGTAPGRVRGWDSSRLYTCTGADPGDTLTHYLLIGNMRFVSVISFHISFCISFVSLHRFSRSSRVHEFLTPLGNSKLGSLCHSRST